MPTVPLHIYLGVVVRVRIAYPCLHICLIYIADEPAKESGVRVACMLDICTAVCNLPYNYVLYIIIDICILYINSAYNII